MIKNIDITVIVHGPVQNYKERQHHEEGITQRCLDSIRTVLPGSTIILSTWKGQNLENLDFDILIEEDDIGENQDDYAPKNYNRQVHLVRKGLDVTTTKYAIKLRSDNYLFNDNFKIEQKKYANINRPHPTLKERVLINANLSRRTSNGFYVISSLSDFFYYGLTADLKTIWDQPNFDKNPLAEKLIAKRRKYSHYPKLEAEQIYCQLWVCALDADIPILGYRYQANNSDIQSWNKFIANNFIINEADTIGLGLRAISIRKKRINEYNFYDWLNLYKIYCNNAINIPFNYKNYVINLKRKFHFPLSKLWTKFKYNLK